jgi:hypothetical protein
MRWDCWTPLGFVMAMCEDACLPIVCALDFSELWVTFLGTKITHGHKPQSPTERPEAAVRNMM